jgi:hypothetical protein
VRLCLLIFYVIRKLQEAELFAIRFPGGKTLGAYEEREKQEKLSFLTGSKALPGNPYKRGSASTQD